MSAQPHSNVTPLNTVKPSASVVYVTPEMADRWLTRNTRNRDIRSDDVDQYARDMTAGKWHLTGEAIKFAADGTLLDGQHRLMAAIKANATVPMWVMRGIPSEAQDVMDTGRKRTASDALTIHGEKNTAILAAASRLALGVNAKFADPGQYQASHAEIQEFIADNPDIREAAEIAHRFARRSDCPPAIVTYTYWVLSHIDRDAAIGFWAAAADKVGLQDGDPVIAMTNRFAEARRNRERLSRRMYLSAIYRAWNYRRAGKPMRLLKFQSPAGGLIPVPDPR